MSGSLSSTRERSGKCAGQLEYVVSPQVSLNNFSTFFNVRRDAQRLAWLVPNVGDINNNNTNNDNIDDSSWTI